MINWIIQVKHFLKVHRGIVRKLNCQRYRVKAAVDKKNPAIIKIRIIIIVKNLQLQTKKFWSNNFDNKIIYLNKFLKKYQYRQIR